MKSLSIPEHKLGRDQYLNAEGEHIIGAPVPRWAPPEVEGDRAWIRLKRIGDSYRAWCLAPNMPAGCLYDSDLYGVQYDYWFEADSPVRAVQVVVEHIHKHH
jgi:hypothetical protein